MPRILKDGTIVLFTKDIPLTCKECGVIFSVIRKPLATFCSMKCYHLDRWRRPRKPAEERFWSKVDRRGPDECWPWLAGKTKRGYGSMGGRGGGRSNRLAWEFTNGPIPDGQVACHKCDVVACCNPSHLFLGTQADNVADMIAKGRDRKAQGEGHPGAKLTERDVLEIRASDDPIADACKRYGVVKSVISAVRLRRTWRHVA